MSAEALKQLCQEHGREVFDGLLSLALKAKEPGTRRGALNDLWDRGYGRPETPHCAPGGGPVQGELVVRLAGDWQPRIGLRGKSE